MSSVTGTKFFTVPATVRPIGPAFAAAPPRPPAPGGPPRPPRPPAAGGGVGSSAVVVCACLVAPKPAPGEGGPLAIVPIAALVVGANACAPAAAPFDCRMNAVTARN